MMYLLTGFAIFTIAVVGWALYTSEEDPYEDEEW